MKKKLFFGVFGLLAIVLLTGSSTGDVSIRESDHDKDSMRVVMRFELKVKPESDAL